MRRRIGRRAGFSLLEMMLATAVLLGCVIVLGELAGIGRKHVDDIEGLSTAEVICQSTLNEMLSGAAVVESFEKRPVDEQPGWMVSAEVMPVKQQGVVSLRVTTWYEDPELGLDAEALPKHRFSLVRWTRDPSTPLASDDGSGSLEPASLMDLIGGGQPAEDDETQ